MSKKKNRNRSRDFEQIDGRKDGRSLWVFLKFLSGRYQGFDELVKF